MKIKGFLQTKKQWDRDYYTAHHCLISVISLCFEQIKFDVSKQYKSIMFDVKILLDKCNIIYTSEQLEKLKGLIEEEIFKLILPAEKPTENSEMSMTEDHTSNENENQNENQIQNQNQNFSDNDNDNDNQG